MAYVDATTMLARIRDAIDAILVRGVQEYELDTGANRRRFRYHDLDTLYKLEERYERKVEREQRGSVSLGVIRRPRG